MKRIISWTLTLAAASLSGLVEPALAKEPDLCTQTARVVRRACDSEVAEELWTAMGLCLNLADAAARAACRKDVRAGREEARSECRDQEEAREDLCDVLGPAAYDPVIDPARFLAPAAIAASPNPFLPLVPGTVWVYENGPETTTVTVTGTTKTILGVTCLVVRDVVEENGMPVEDTDDYFAQDVDGVVWYFGELSKSFENGELVGLDGSWTAGVEGAKPGIVMLAPPVVGAVYRQEFALTEAEDGGEVLSITGTETVPGAACDGTCVVTRDFNSLEPDADERKFYAPGVGLILAVDQETGERDQLVSFATP